MELNDDTDISFRSNIPVPLDITVAVVYSVFGLCSLFGNTTLLYVSYKKKHLLKPAEYFIVNLAVSDLGLTLSLYPMAITSSFYHRWLYGKTVCSIYAFCGMLFGLCSLTTLTLLSMVCFVKVCCPLYGNRFNSVHGCLLIASAWVYALLFASSPLAHWGEYGPEPYGTACCIDWRLSNEHPTARSFTVMLFIFCYILPCCVIVASYTGILVTVYASRKTMEQHASRQTHMSNIQAIIVKGEHKNLMLYDAYALFVKLSVAVCIGFLAAWSPYAIVSMWAAFGQIESIPPLAFAMPAMFAKSSTIYNPVIYLMLRPNFRRVMRRDLGGLYQACLRGCSRPDKGVRLRMIHRQTPSCNSATQPPAVATKDSNCDKCKDAFECFTHYPQMCTVTHSAAKGGPFDDQDSAVLQTNKQRAPSMSHKKCLLATMCAKRTSEIDNLHISLEMVPGHAKVAWP